MHFFRRQSRDSCRKKKKSQFGASARQSLLSMQHQHRANVLSSSIALCERKIGIIKDVFALCKESRSKLLELAKYDA
jgi:hypothetical protein